MAKEFTYPLLGTAVGASTSAVIGNIGLVGSFGGVSVTTLPVALTGCTMGFAAYGMKEVIRNNDSSVIFPIATGAVIGSGISSAIGGGIGLSAARTAIGISSTAITIAGGIVGLGVYGAFKFIDSMGSGETAFQAFNRIEERMETEIMDSEFYTEALQEVFELINPDEALKQKFRDLEIEEESPEIEKELQQLKMELKQFTPPQKFKFKIEVKGWYSWHPNIPISRTPIKK